MTKLKFDVSASDADKAVAGAGMSPQPGMYHAKIAEINERDGRGDDGRPDPDRPMLEVVYQIVKADKKANDKFKGSRVWSYLMLPGHPSYEQTVWKIDQFLQAVGVANKRKRKGTFDPEEHVDGDVTIVVRAGKNQNDEYRGEIAQVLQYDAETFGQSDSDDDDDEEVEVDDDDIEETEDEDVDEDADDEEEDADYSDWSLADLRAELESRGLDAVKGKAKMVAALEADDESDEEGDEDEDEEPDEDEEGEGTDYDELGVAELRKELADRGLSKAGPKSKLIERLVEDDESDDEDADEDDEEDEDEEPEPTPRKKATAKKATAKKTTARKGGKKRDGFPFDDE